VMRKMEKATRTRLILVLAIIGLGIGSRASTTGLAVLDKYLGDALYAAMFFVLGTIALNGRENLSALIAALIVGSLEVFQRSNIPLEMSASNNPLIRLAATLIGTKFGYLDILV
jgi:hypothetical protein